MAKAITLIEARTQIKSHLRFRYWKLAVGAMVLSVVIYLLTALIDATLLIADGQHVVLWFLGLFILCVALIPALKEFIWNVFRTELKCRHLNWNIFCPFCDKHLPILDPWICRHCNHENKPKIIQHIFLCRCEKCGNEPKIFKCPHCPRELFLVETEVKGFSSESIKFVLGDIKHLSSLAIKLTDPTDGVSGFLYKRFDASLCQRIEQFADTSANDDELESDLLKEFNALLTLESFYLEERFKGVVLREETKKLIELKLKDEKQIFDGKMLVQLNKLLLEDAYPQELRKNFVANYPEPPVITKTIEQQRADELASRRFDYRRINFSFVSKICG